MAEFNARLKKLAYTHTGLAQGISQTLMDAIITGVLKGGERLAEAELQKQFGVSKSPVREALRDLEKKYLVEIKPRRGAFVRTIYHTDVLENFQAREVLEGLAFREAYKRMTDKDVGAMKKAFEKMQMAAKQNNPKKYLESHHSFHEIYLCASGNRLIIDMVRNLRRQNLFYQFSHQYYKKDFNLKDDTSTHVGIMNCIKKKNVKESDVENLMRHHIGLGRQRFLKYLRKKGKGEEKKK